MAEKFLILLISYLIGSISPAYLIAKFLYGFDIRTRGSGNPGTTNAYRTMGLKVAIVTLVFDVTKAALGAYLGYKFIGRDFAPYTGLMGILGHNFPFYLNFNGGKGVATSIGAVFVIAPKILLICATPALVVLFFTKIISAASITAFVILFFVAAFISFKSGFSSYVVVFFIISILNLVRHKPNIIRLLNGTEKKIK